MMSTNPTMHFVCVWRSDEGDLMAMDMLGRAYIRAKGVVADDLPALEERGDWERAEEWDHPDREDELVYSIGPEDGAAVPVEIQHTVECNFDTYNMDPLPVSLDISVSQG